MTPTIVMRDDELFFTTGSPGGSRIISAVLQSILNIIDFEMDLEEANKSREFIINGNQIFYKLNFHLMMI